MDYYVFFYNKKLYSLKIYFFILNIFKFLNIILFDKKTFYYLTNIFNS
jgi:hypothetical protein